MTLSSSVSVSNSAHSRSLFSLRHPPAVYNDLPHPPATYVGDEYARRNPDGSGNNPADPDLGKAGMPYSRSVQQINPLPRNELPDAGLLFDTLLKREKVRCSALYASEILRLRLVCTTSLWPFEHDVCVCCGCDPYVRAATVFLVDSANGSIPACSELLTRKTASTRRHRISIWRLCTATTQMLRAECGTKRRKEEVCCSRTRLPRTDFCSCPLRFASFSCSSTATTT